MQNRRTSQILLLCSLTCLANCSRPSSERDDSASPATGPITVYTVNYPLQYFAQRIGGQHVKALFPAPADVDPAYWTPNAQIVEAYQNADRILLNGASYANWTKFVSLPSSKLVDTSASFREQYSQVAGAITHSHGPGGEHAHGGTAFTTWLDPQLAIQQAATIHAELIALRPKYKDDFDRGFDSLKMDLEQLDTQVMAIVEGKTNQPLVFSHPVYQYLTRRYNLNAESMHWEPDEMPSATMWQEYASLLDRHPAAWMIWEGEPGADIVSRLREMHVESIVFAPCGNRPSHGDYLSAMRTNAENLGKVFGSEE